jgi:hypothetical protein
VSGQTDGTTSAAGLLAEMDRLRRRTRRARHGYRFPVLLFGLLMLAPAPLYVEPVDPPAIQAGRAIAPLSGLGGGYLTHAAALGWYWLAALPGGYLASLAWYRWRAMRTGLATRTLPWLVAGAAGVLLGLVLPVVLRLLVLNTAGPVSSGANRLTGPVQGVVNHGMTAHLVIAIGLLVLARIEHSRALWAVAAGFAAVFLAVTGYFVAGNGTGRYGFAVAALLPALVPLLAAGAAAARLAWRGGPARIHAA